MIRALYRSSQGKLTIDLSPDQIREALRDPEGDLWVDVVHVPDNVKQITTFLRETFQFHPLSLDDALTETHVPRVDAWQDYLYIVLHALDLELNRTLDTHELDIFLGKNFIVTIHEEPITALDRMWDQCRRGAERRLASGPDHLLYLIADAIVADYMPVVDGLDDEIDELEKDIFENPRPRTVGRIFRIRRTLLRLRRILGALREVMTRLARDDYPMIDAGDRVYFRDVYDHLVRLYEIVEGLRDMVGGALDSYLSITSNRMNEIMRTLTMVTVLFMPISFLTGFFGMNFFGEAYNIPNAAGGTEPFAWVNQVLFWLTMAVLLATPPFMLWWMARRGWLRSLTADDEEDEPRADS